MSLNIIKYPVLNVGQNVFGGFSPVEVQFKREDIQIIDTEQAIDNTVQINLSSDLSSALNVGEYIYFESGNYALSAEVLDIDPSFIRVNTQWIEASVLGYVNYKQNYYIEIDTVDTENANIKILPFVLADDGDEAGIINIDLSIINDLNAIEEVDYSQVNEMAESRVKFNIEYREVWREDQNQPFTPVNDPIIIYPAKETPTLEQFTNAFSEPEYYIGYPNGAVFLHSDAAPIGADEIVFYYDELDINNEVIKANNKIGELAAREVYGRLFAPLYNLVLLENTEYITLRGENEVIPEFSPIDFTNDFNIG